jgi:hypothetical protein
MADEAAVPQDLRDYIRQCVFDYFKTNSGMPIAFVCAIDWIDGTDGAAALTVAAFDGQPTHRSFGLVRFLDEVFQYDACNEITSNFTVTEDED